MTGRKREGEIGKIGIQKKILFFVTQNLKQIDEIKLGI